MALRWRPPAWHRRPVLPFPLGSHGTTHRPPASSVRTPPPPGWLASARGATSRRTRRRPRPGCLGFGGFWLCRRTQHSLHCLGVADEFLAVLFPPQRLVWLVLGTLGGSLVARCGSAGSGRSRAGAAHCAAQ